MERLKILHVIETLAVEGGGGDRACAELAEAQALNGHAVTILCTDTARRPTPFSLDNVSIISVQASGWFARELGWNPTFDARLRSVLEDTDIVHCHGAWRMLQVYVRRACLDLGVPYIQQPHGSFMPNRLLHRKWKKLIWGALFERRNLAEAAALHAETDGDLRDISDYIWHPNIYILPCGSWPVEGALEDKEFYARYPMLAHKLFLLYFGRLDFNKGVDLLIKAFDKLAADCPDTNLAIVGPDYNQTKSKLERLVDSRGIENVYFLPAVSDDLEKTALFSHAACFVLPSHSENFGITVLEALLVGCPVLVSRQTGWSSLEQEGAGLIFDPTLNGVKNALSRFFFNE